MKISSGPSNFSILGLIPIKKMIVVGVRVRVRERVRVRVRVT